PFPNPYFMPNPIMAATAAQRMAAPFAPQPKECGAVATWKRIQGSNGKFQAFGFCEFESPFGTMRALRILHDYPLAEKKLVVKIDDKTRTMVKEYVARKRVEKNLPPEILTSDEMPADEDNVVDDEEIRQKIQTLIEKDAPDLVPIEDGELAEKTRSPVLEKGKDRIRDRSIEKRKERKWYISRVWCVCGKARIHADGKGKTGDVRLVKSIEETQQLIKDMIGLILPAHQTGPNEQQIRRFYIEEGSKFYPFQVNQIRTTDKLIDFETTRSLKNLKSNQSHLAVICTTTQQKIVALVYKNCHHFPSSIAAPFTKHN
ncbi:hypothetical protein X798_07878, partial [Onchocerca flexuosa]